jgi:hypothetical protein
MNIWLQLCALQRQHLHQILENLSATVCNSTTCHINLLSTVNESYSFDSWPSCRFWRCLRILTATLAKYDPFPAWQNASNFWSGPSKKKFTYLGLRGDPASWSKFISRTHTHIHTLIVSSLIFVYVWIVWSHHVTFSLHNCQTSRLNG